MSAFEPCPKCKGWGKIAGFPCLRCEGRGSVPIPGTCCTGHHLGQGHDGTCSLRLSRSAGS